MLKVVTNGTALAGASRDDEPSVFVSGARGQEDTRNEVILQYGPVQLKIKKTSHSGDWAHGNSFGFSSEEVMR
jgi:hypothetical protein